MNQLAEMGATSIVALFQTTKVERASFVNQLVTAVDEGDVNPLKLHLQIKCMEEIIEALKANPLYKESLLNEAQKQGAGKAFEFMNAKIEIKEIGVKYSFDLCGDDEILELQQKLSEVKAKVDERTKLLKAIPTNGTIITNEETGETKKIYPPQKSSTTSTVVTLK